MSIIFLYNLITAYTVQNGLSNISRDHEKTVSCCHKNLPLVNRQFQEKCWKTVLIVQIFLKIKTKKVKQTIVDLRLFKGDYSITFLKISKLSDNPIINANEARVVENPVFGSSMMNCTWKLH